MNTVEKYSWQWIVEKVPHIDEETAKNRAWRFKRGRITEKQLTLPPKGIYIKDGEKLTTDRIVRATGFSRRTALSKILAYLDGKISRDELFRKKGSKIVKETPAVVYDPNDRSPGWWERANLNPTSVSSGKPSANYQTLNG